MSVEQKITQHEGRKYLRRILPADGHGEPILVDVYAVLVAFGVTCPAQAHALKKLLCCGNRGKGDRRADLVGVLAAVNRAINLQDNEGYDFGSSSSSSSSSAIPDEPPLVTNAAGEDVCLACDKPTNECVC